MSDSQIGIIDLLFQAGPVVLFVLVVLLLFSVGSWAIILYKFGAVRSSMNESKAFLDCFFESGSADRIFSESEKFRNGSLSKVFRAAYIENRAVAASPGAVDDRLRIARAVKREANLEAKDSPLSCRFLQQWEIRPLSLDFSGQSGES